MFPGLPSNAAALQNPGADQKGVPEAPKDVINETRPAVQKTKLEEIVPEEEQEGPRQKRQPVPDLQFDPALPFRLAPPESDADGRIVSAGKRLLKKLFGFQARVTVVPGHPVCERFPVLVVKRLLQITRRPIENRVLVEGTIFKPPVPPEEPQKPGGIKPSVLQPASEEMCRNAR